MAENADEVRETHISWVFLTGETAYKVKKPVSLGFLDFSTIEKRRAACEAEVELGARLAPDVYRRVIPLEGDWAVEMRRLRDEDSAEARLARGELGIAEIDRIAERIAVFHEGARCDAHTAAFGATSVIEGNVRENFAQTRIESFLPPAQAEEIASRQLADLRERGAFFRDRVAHQRVKDGHGDLRLEHVYLEGDAITVIDCIEFNERFRFADVCADVAFLAMDLAWHGRTDLAERFLATYARETSDFDLYRVVDFYEGYRAYVRGKISAMHDSERAREQARRYFLLALAAERPRIVPPMLVALGGTLATGKSTIADRLGALMGAPSINTDRVRKHLVGARPTDKLYDGSWEGAYEPSMTDRVYSALSRGAHAVLGSRRPVILDATFRTKSSRAQARELAREQDVPFLFVECTAPDEVCRERLRQRALGPSVSDGRLEIFEDIRRSWEPVTELPPSELLLLDTSRPLDETLARLRERISLWPR